MFKHKLKDLRKQRDYTQDDLARKLSISRQSVSKWENGISYPTKGMLTKICELFDLQVSDLLDNEEVLFLSIDNNTGVKSIKRRTIFITSTILVIALTIIMVVWIFNDRINQIENPNESPIVSDPLVGFIALDQTGIVAYENNDVSLMSLIESRLYPFNYLDLTNQYSFWDSNKLFDHRIMINDSETNETFTIYVKRSVGVNIYYITPIKYSLDNGEYYLESSSGVSGSGLSSFSTTLQDTKNDIIDRDTKLVVTVKFVDELNQVELFQYDESQAYIDNQEMLINETISLNIETLYFIIRETYSNSSGDVYINKIQIHHNDFDEYYFYQYRTFDENNFAKANLVTINTKV